MFETGNHLLAFCLYSTGNFMKSEIMEASDVKPSFLCFLPEFQCAPANFVYIDGITDSNISEKAVPLSLSKKCPYGTVDLTNRLSSVSAEAEPCLSNGFAQSKETSANNCCSVGISEKETWHKPLDMATETDGNFCPVGIVEKRAHDEPIDIDQVTGTNSPTLDIRGPMNDQPVEESSGQTDILAFEIVEFFSAFQDGQEHKLLKFTEKSDFSSPAGKLLQPECGKWGARSSPALIDQHSKSDKVAIPVDVDHIDGRINSNASRSGKWNGSLEVDSFSATFSEPLTFSGPMSYSGNSGHGPYSGNVSHRSDSSTASTHSFAFPILPYEWNSSPVKMAPPDRRFMQRPWKRRLRSLFCCCAD